MLYLLKLVVMFLFNLKEAFKKKLVWYETSFVTKTLEKWPYLQDSTAIGKTD